MKKERSNCRLNWVKVEGRCNGTQPLAKEEMLDVEAVNQLLVAGLPKMCPQRSRRRNDRVLEPEILAEILSYLYLGSESEIEPRYLREINTVWKG